MWCDEFIFHTHFHHQIRVVYAGSHRSVDGSGVEGALAGPRPEREADQRDQKVAEEQEELSVEAELDERVPLGLEQVDQHAL